MKCPSCHNELKTDNINIKANVAHCTNCNEIFKISSLLSSTKEVKNKKKRFDFSNQPTGVELKKKANLLEIKLSLVRIPLIVAAIIMIIATLFCIVVSNDMPFFIIFIFISVLLYLIGLLILHSFGSLVVTLTPKRCQIAIGIGELSSIKYFNLKDINAVTEATGKRRGVRYLVLEGQKAIKLGAGLSEKRRYYLRKALEQIIKDEKDGEDYLNPDLTKKSKRKSRR